jgi:hypothetical protein
MASRQSETFSILVRFLLLRKLRLPELDQLDYFDSRDVGWKARMPSVLILGLTFPPT